MSGPIFNPNKVVVYGTMIKDNEEPFQAQIEFKTNDVVIEQECSYGSKSVKMEFSVINEALTYPEIAEAAPSEKWEVSW